MSFKVKLKTHEEISNECNEYDGGVELDGVEYNYDVLSTNGFFNSVLLATSTYEYYSGMYALIVETVEGKKIYVHPKWIARWGGHKVTMYKKLSNTLLKVTDKDIVDYNKCSLIDINDLETCECGSVYTHVMSDSKKYCSTCYDKLTELENYSYRPDPIFFGKQLKADEDNNVWFGMELEGSWDRYKLAEVVHKHKDELYLKSDASIKGNDYNAEIVTHPHSLKELTKKGGILDSIGDLTTVDNDENGVHVHISRTSFVDDKHYSLFYFLLHEMSDVCTHIGGRELTNYCKLKPTGKISRKANHHIEGDRHVFLNEKGKDTVEARFFKSTADVTRLKAYVQLLNSMIKYTKYHNKKTSTDWYKYITKYSKTYKELLDVLGDYLNNKPTRIVEYKEPKLKTLTTKDEFMNMTLKCMSNAVNIKYREESVLSSDSINIVEVSSVGFVEGIIYTCNSVTNVTPSININNVISITIEEE